MEKLTIDEIIGHCERKTEQYERFYKREYLETMPLTSSAIKEYWEHRQVAEYLRKLKDYENLEEQGRLIKLPCKVGDTVYLIKNNETIVECKADMMFLGVLWEEFGKEWFLTKSEAEAKLKELEGGEVAPKMDTKVANKENVISFLKKRFPNKIQMFDTRNFVGDHMITIYDSNGVVIDYCPDYDYIEIFGLTDDEFAIVVKECGYN